MIYSALARIRELSEWIEGQELLSEDINKIVGVLDDLSTEIMYSRYAYHLYHNDSSSVEDFKKHFGFLIDTEVHNEIVDRVRELKKKDEESNKWIAEIEKILREVGVNI